VSFTEGIVVPAHGRGLARVAWAPRDQKQERFSLNIEVWSQPKGQPQARGRQTTLLTTIRFVPPVAADVMELKLRPIEARSSSSAAFWCWTATRPEARALRVLAEKEDPCFTFKVTPADEKQRLALQDALWAEHHTLVKAAWRVEVTAHEDRQGKQMDLGAFARRLSLYLDDEKEPQVGPYLKGVVSSDVSVGAAIGNSEGKVELGVIKTDKNFTRTVKLRTEPGVELKVQESDLAFLKVSLTRNAKESTKRRLVWDLRVDIPRRGGDNDFTGPLPDNSAIILTRERDGSPPRRIRILVEGTVEAR
jgi:hypothetical protein